jgi:DNA-binding MarR family transcriptional regulator
VDERERIIREIIKVLPELAVNLNRDAATHGSADPAGRGASTAQIRALVHLAQYGRQAMGELAEGLQITMASATGLINPLVEMGHVIRSRDDEDHRVVRVGLSREAQAMADKILAARRREVEDALVGMDDLSCRHFLEGLERLAGRNR